MSFVVKLQSDEVSVEAGATTPLSIEVINRGESADQFEFAIEGLDPEWTAIPVPTVTLQPQDSSQEKLFFRVPRTNESLAGNYPFVVKVRSLSTGDSRTVQGVLTIKPFHHISIDISPKKGYFSAFSKNNTFQATLINLGNTDHSLQLFGSDPEDHCSFEFDSEQVGLSAGQQRNVNITVSPRSQRFFLSSRLFGFSISARSTDNPSVMAVAQGQLEHRPIFGFGTLVTMLIAAIIFVLWLLVLPKQPSFQLTSDVTQGLTGQKVTLTWKAPDNASEVDLFALGQPIYHGPANPNSTTYVLPDKGTVEISGYAIKSGLKSQIQTVSIDVTAPVQPVIQNFSVSPNPIIYGQQYTIHYEVQNATKIVLLPTQETLELGLTDKTLAANDLNLKRLTLVVYGTDPVHPVAQKSIDVSVIQPSKSKIIAFDVSPQSLPFGGGVVKVSWQLNSDTVRTEISIGDAAATSLPVLGEQMVPISKDTVITLTGYDSSGLKVSKSISVKVDATDPNEPGTGPDGPDTGGSGGAATAGGGAAGSSSGTNAGGPLRTSGTGNP